jgi:ligand-binding SRPBCC domain-containing protein
MAFYQIRTQQFLAAKLDAVWDFISSPANLKKITPEHMGFDITTPEISKKMYPGMVIGYKVRPIWGFKTTWITEITHVAEKQYFVDEQRLGPYTMWHHEHHIEERDGGVMMTDIVSYIPPFGFIGSIANSLFIRQQLDTIFSYREKRLDDIFNQTWKPLC